MQHREDFKDILLHLVEDGVREGRQISPADVGEALAVVQSCFRERIDHFFDLVVEPAAQAGLLVLVPKARFGDVTNGVWQPLERDRHEVPCAAYPSCLSKVAATQGGPWPARRAAGVQPAVLRSSRPPFRRQAPLVGGNRQTTGRSDATAAVAKPESAVPVLSRSLCQSTSTPAVGEAKSAAISAEMSSSLTICSMWPRNAGRF